MAHFSFQLFLLTFLSLKAWCQTVQDDWTAPASPDNSTSLQSGNPFTLIWKSGLQDEFGGYCTSCNIQQLDLWITSFLNGDYNFKIGGELNELLGDIAVTDFVCSRHQSHYYVLVRLERQHTHCRTFGRKRLGVPFHPFRFEASVRPAGLVSGGQHHRSRAGLFQ
jgi:hypothetical protein